MDPVVDPKRRQAIKNTMVLPTISKQISHHRNLNDVVHLVDIWCMGDALAWYK
jgi:hypothetical protein